MCALKLGNPLFHRGHREVSLTETGSRLARELTPAFSSIAAAYRTVRNRRTLRLTAAPLFSAQFILPQLDELSTVLRDVSIELESSISIADLSSGRHDLALRFGPQPAPPLQSIEVCGAGLSIVAAPSLTKSQDTEQPLSIGDFPMLSLAQYPNAWAEVSGGRRKVCPLGPDFPVGSIADAVCGRPQADCCAQPQ